MSEPIRRVSCELALSVLEPVRLSLQVAPSNEFLDLTETLQITSDGVPVAVEEIDIAGLGRVHVCYPTPGRVEVNYQATVTGRARVRKVTDAERIVYRRPSRYAESDRLAPIAQAEFAGITDARELLEGVSSWVGTRLSYVEGSSGPTDGSVETMLKRQGVCRDYAHLVIAMLRALDVPARLAAVYSPGLHPMDFHAVVEAAVDDTWLVSDATLLAPRSSFVRICTGRDAGDTAFLSTYGGQADLLYSTVTATIDGMLPSDDVHQHLSIT
ncbi:MAG: transglutaminase-like domain-containing protein [Actinomycetota bacterium]|nr:transglutaminase-like domain-containing protein [Actinomycetota bacterium]